MAPARNPTSSSRSRIRLARNLADFPFIARATESDRDEVGRILRERVATLHGAASSRAN